MKKSLFLICLDCDYEFSSTVTIDPEMPELIDNISGVICPQCASSSIEIDGEDITGMYER